MTVFSDDDRTMPTISSTRHPNGKDLRLTLMDGDQAVAVESVRPGETVGDAIAAYERLKVLSQQPERPRPSY